MGEFGRDKFALKAHRAFFRLWSRVSEVSKKQFKELK